MKLGKELLDLFFKLGYKGIKRARSAGEVTKSLTEEDRMVTLLGVFVVAVAIIFLIGIIYANSVPKNHPALRSDSGRPT